MPDDDKHSKLVVDLLEKNLKQSEKTQKCVDHLRGDFNLHVQKTEYELKEITRTNEVQNQSLEEHQKRSDAIQKDVNLRERQIREDVFGKEGIEPRVTKLEEPRKFIKSLAKVIIGLGTIAGAVWAFLRFLV